MDGRNVARVHTGKEDQRKNALRRSHPPTPPDFNVEGVKLPHCCFNGGQHFIHPEGGSKHRIKRSQRTRLPINIEEGGAGELLRDDVANSFPPLDLT